MLEKRHIENRCLDLKCVLALPYYMVLIAVHTVHFSGARSPAPAPGMLRNQVSYCHLTSSCMTKKHFYCNRSVSVVKAWTDQYDQNILHTRHDLSRQVR